MTSIPATVNFDPDTLNLGSRGKWVTVYIELPSGYDAWSIKCKATFLAGGERTEYGEKPNDYKLEFTVRYYF